MNNKLERIFNNIDKSDSLDILSSKIILQINQIQFKRARLRVVVSRTIGSLSFIALFPIFINMHNQLQSSGFWNYFSLLFTDTSVVATYWKEFSLSLVDSLPLFQITVLLILILSLFISLRFSLKSFGRVGLSTNLA